MSPSRDDDPPAVRRKRFAAREAWLVANIRSLRPSIDRAPWMLGGLVIVPFVGWRWNFIAAAMAAFSVIVLAGTTLYVAWSHAQEYEGELAALREKIRALPSDVTA